MKSFEGIDFYKWATIKNQFRIKVKESLIVHPELLLWINNPDWIKWTYQIPLKLLINIEHYILFANGAVWTCAFRY